MSNRRPTPAQRRILTALRDSETTHRLDENGGTTPGLATKAQIATLLRNEWVRADDENILRLTNFGEHVLADEEARIAYAAHIEAPGRSTVRITRRSRGRGVVAGSGRVSAGRNVVCSDCYRREVAEREASGSHITASREVWFTNEPGAAAERDAEAAAGRHILRHTSGELPPFGPAASF